MTAPQQQRSWRRALAPIREFGLCDGTLYLMHRALQAISRGRASVVAYGLYAQPIGDGAYAGVRDDSRTQIKEALPGDRLSTAFPRAASVITTRYSEGARCHVAVIKGVFAGYIWISRTQHDEDEVRVRYLLEWPQSSAWDFDVYVVPEWRLGRTLARLWKAVDEYLARDGVKWSFSRISRFNRPSVAAHARLGALRVGSATFFVCGPLQLLVSTVRPCLHLSLHERSRPLLRLTPPR